MNITHIIVRPPVKSQACAVPASVKGSWLALALITTFLLAGSAEALEIIPTFVNAAGESWTDSRKSVINQAIADWEASVLESQTVPFTITFDHAASSYLGQWTASGSFYPETDIYPWTSGISQTIKFNVDLFADTGSGYLWWDPTPSTDGDVPPSAWDALSVARHEIGHMMGFTDGFYVDDFYTANERNRWMDHVVGTMFDPGGLAVSLASASDLSHVSGSGATAGDMMTPNRPSGTRSDISRTDLDMLALAHGYTVEYEIPPVTEIPGDLDGDCDVDIFDWMIFQPNFGITSGATYNDGDLDGDADIDIFDWMIFQPNFGQTCGDLGASVPEPAALSLLALGGLTLIRRRS